MFITDILKVVNISIETEVADKDSAIKVLVNIAARNNPLPHDKITNCITEREKVRSTAFGKGCAMPMGFCNDLLAPAISILIVKKPVDWSGTPVYLATLVAAPVRLKNAYIELLSRLARIFSNDILREQILNATTSAQIMAIIETNDKH